MNIPRVSPPPRSARGQGRRPVLTRIDEIEVWSWYQAKRAIGTYRTKAKELGIPMSELRQMVKRMSDRKRNRYG